jgi:hypothetical protein
MSRNPITPIEGANLVRTGGQQFLAPVEPTHLVKYKGLPKIGASKPTQSKQSKYKLEPPLLDREFKPTITEGHLADEYNSFEENQIYVSPELREVYKKEGIWDSIVKYNDLLDERAANLMGYDKLMSQAELDSNYTKIVALRNTIMSSSGALDTRLPPLDTETSVGPSVPPTETPVGPRTPDMPVGPDLEDDTDAIVNYEVNQEIDTSGLEGVGTERASVVDPAEVSLFISSSAEAKQEQKRFDQFSRVEPGNSLGSMKDNLLRQQNAISDSRQFSHTLATAPKYNPTLGREYHSPYIVPTLQAVEDKNRGNQNQPYRINVTQADFGKVQFEEDGYRANYLMSSHLTPEKINSNNWRSWDNQYSIYHPDLALSRYKFKPTEIPELRNDGFSFGLHNIKPSMQGNILYANNQTGYDFTPLMRDDRYGSKSTVKSNIDINSQRIISSRM